MIKQLTGAEVNMLSGVLKCEPLQDNPKLMKFGMSVLASAAPFPSLVGQKQAFSYFSMLKSHSLPNVSSIEQVWLEKA